MPGVISQLNLNTDGAGSSPSALRTLSPGQSISRVTLSSAVLTGPHWASERTATMITYGA